MPHQYDLTDKEILVLFSFNKGTGSHNCNFYDETKLLRPIINALKITTSKDQKKLVELATLQGERNKFGFIAYVKSLQTHF